MAQNLTLISLLTGGSGCATLQPTTTPQPLSFNLIYESTGPTMGFHPVNKMVVNSLDLGRGVIWNSISTDVSKFGISFYKNLDPCSKQDTTKTTGSTDIAGGGASSNQVAEIAMNGNGSYVVQTISGFAMNTNPSDITVALSAANPCKQSITLSSTNQSVQFGQVGNSPIAILTINNILATQSVIISTSTTNMQSFSNFVYFNGSTACNPTSLASNAFTVNGASTTTNVILNPAIGGNYIILLSGVNVSVPSDVVAKVQ
ncbi:hypothetical protein EHO61_08870 [Leptospira fluminis]|uniref:Uncharacterized protein n=1 Tax=Leptospira fluminis TaxID=2484979 RepID=A0A4R9GRL4_9LEPT|nr:hypothetical protein [Leptospira fluminis]TGK19003.1 hypothetical protein EHO61_08870 [Leptospira fluminis]